MASGRFGMGARAGKTSFTVSTGRGSRDKQFSMSGDSQDAWWGASSGMRVDWEVGESDDVTLQGDIARSVAGRKDLRPMATAPFSFTNVENEVTSAGNVLARWNHRLKDGSNW